MKSLTSGNVPDIGVLMRPSEDSEPSVDTWEDDLISSWEDDLLMQWEEDNLLDGSTLRDREEEDVQRRRHCCPGTYCSTATETCVSPSISNHFRSSCTTQAQCRGAYLLIPYEISDESFGYAIKLFSESCDGSGRVFRAFAQYCHEGGCSFYNYDGYARYRYGWYLDTGRRYDPQVETCAEAVCPEADGYKGNEYYGYDCFYSG